MPIFDFREYKLKYSLIESPNKEYPLLIFIHGIGGDLGVWKYQVEYFKNKYNILTLDLFGHGQSSKNVSPDEFINTSAETILRLKREINPKGYILIGHSFASNIMPKIILRSDNDLIGTVFIDCVYQEQMRLIEAREKMADFMLSEDDETLESETRRWYLEMTAGLNDPEQTAFILSSLESCNSRWLFQTIKASCDYNRKNNQKYTLIKDNMKTLVVEADQGEIGTYFNKSWINRYKDSQFSIFEDSNHFLFITNHEKFNLLLDEFIIDCIG